MSGKVINSGLKMLIAHLRKGLALSVSCALIMVGSLIWLDNSLAVIPDGDPATFVQLDLIDGAEDQGPSDHQLYGAEKTGPAQAGALFVRGNGDRDDNREKSYSTSRSMHVTALPEPMAAVSDFQERRTVAAYRDFGHLRVMSTDKVQLNNLFYNSGLLSAIRPF